MMFLLGGTFDTETLTSASANGSMLDVQCGREGALNTIRDIIDNTGGRVGAHSCIPNGSALRDGTMLGSMSKVHQERHEMLSATMDLSHGLKLRQAMPPQRGTQGGMRASQNPTQPGSPTREAGSSGPSPRVSRCIPSGHPNMKF